MVCLHLLPAVDDNNVMERPRVAGVCLVAENGTPSDSSSHTLGVVVLHDTSAMSVTVLRCLVAEQLCSIPQNYRFLTTGG